MAVAGGVATSLGQLRVIYVCPRLGPHVQLLACRPLPLLDTTGSITTPTDYTFSRVRAALPDFFHDMLSNWDKYGRFSLDLASTATTIGFSTAKACTRLGVRYFYFHVQSTTNS